MERSRNSSSVLSIKLQFHTGGWPCCVKFFLLLIVSLKLGNSYAINIQPPVGKKEDLFLQETKHVHQSFGTFPFELSTFKLVIHLDYFASSPPDIFLLPFPFLFQYFVKNMLIIIRPKSS